MTETQWRTCGNPEAMLNYLTERANPRKLRLYAIGCCRRIWHLLTDERCRHAVEVAQRHVDGRASKPDMEAAGLVVASVARGLSDGSDYSRSVQAIGGAAWSATRPSPWVAAWDAAWNARLAARDSASGACWEFERAWQAELLLDLIGSPHRPVRLDPLWLAQDDSTVVKLARVIYDEARFGDLPYLADALEEAGCWNQDVLTHCRARQAHYRGCWVVDSILGL